MCNDFIQHTDFRELLINLSFGIYCTLCTYVSFTENPPHRAGHRCTNSWNTKWGLHYLGLLCDERFASIPMTTVRKKNAFGYFFCSSMQLWKLLTCFLNCWHSSGVRVSALAISGMTLTFSCNRFMNSMSKGFSLQGEKDTTLNVLQTVSNHLESLCTSDLVLTPFIF